MMLLVLVVVSLLGSTSEAQPDSPGCIAATEALGMNTRCNNSVQHVSQGTYNHRQFDRACNEGPCRELWSDMIDVCNPELQGGDLAALICAQPNRSITCNDLFTNTIGYFNAYETYFREVLRICLPVYVRDGHCATECKDLLSEAVERFGCCWAELVNTLTDLPFLFVDEPQAAWILDALPNLCGVDVKFCYDHPFPEHPDCEILHDKIYVNRADTCGAAAIMYQMTNYTTGLEDILNTDDCAALYGNFTDACSKLEPITLEWICQIQSIRANTRIRRRRATITFSSRSQHPDIKYHCKLDNKQSRRCNNPVTYTNLSEGRHTVRIVGRCPGGARKIRNVSFMIGN